jgi:hypothetical protein
MEGIINALLSAGYIVTFMPGRSTDNGSVDYDVGGFTVQIYSRAYSITGVRTEAWSEHAPSPEVALKLAAIRLRDHMRPAYVGYVDLANRMGWEK